MAAAWTAYNDEAFWLYLVDSELNCHWNVMSEHHGIHSQADKVYVLLLDGRCDGKNVS